MKKVLTSLALGVAFAASASAQIFSEQFNNGLAQDATLIGVAGSSGNNWVMSNGTTNSLSYSTTSLEYSGLTSSGGSGLVGAQANLPQQAVTFDNDGTQYFSFLFQHLNAANVSGGRILFEAFGGSGEGYGINYNRNTDGSLTVFARAGGSNPSSVTVLTGAAANPVLVVGKFDPTASAFGSTTIWINPTSFTDEASMIASLALPGPNTATSAAAATVVRDDGIVFRTSASPPGNWLQVDNMRFADDFSGLGLSAVPEPSAFAALAGLGALGFAALRRRRA
jgi:hypothetical protein